jgi:2-hydroxychromene-2-carboxylate isomerase
MATIEFFYDFTSPYSYLASTRVKEVADRTGATFEPRPFALGGVFKAVGTDKIPAENPYKAAYMARDVAAWARDYGVPFAFPDTFPANTIKAMRAVLAVEDRSDAWRLTQALYNAYWGEGRDISQLDVLMDVITKADLNAADLLTATERPEIKARLKANGEEAVARGAFGAPAIFVGEQMFIGNDRLHFVERAAKGEQVFPL